MGNEILQLPIALPETAIFYSYDEAFKELRKERAGKS